MKWKTRLKGWLKKQRKAFFVLGTGALGFLAARCIWLLEFRVAALAVVAASPALGLPVLPMALGSALGILSDGLDHWIRLPMLVLLTTGVYFTQKRTRPWLHLAMMLLAEAGSALFLGRDYFRMILLGVESVAAAGVMLAFWLSGAHIRRKNILPPGQAALVMTVAFAVTVSGLPGIYETPFSPCMAVMALAVMAAGALGGTAVGTTAGLALGTMAAMASRITWDAAGALALGGLVCASVAAMGRPLGSLGFALGFAVPLILQMKDPTAILPYPAALMAMAAYAAVPSVHWERLAGRLIHGGPAAEPDKPPLEAARERMDAMANCLARLANVFSQTELPETDLPDMQPATQVLRLRVCGGCPEQEVCWQGMDGLLADAVAHAGERNCLWEEDLPREFRESCPRLDAFMQVLAGAYGFYHHQTQRDAELEEMQRLVGKQLDGMGRVLKRMGGEMTLRMGNDSLRQRLVKQTLSHEGLAVQHVKVQRDADGHWLVRLQMPSCGGRKVCSVVAAPMLSRLFGRPMAPDEGSCAAHGKACQLIFRQAEVMEVDSAAVQLPANEVCGDAFLHRQMEHPGYLLAISDGMGTGIRAAKEAHATLDLLESFYDAGFDEDVIFSGINQVLMMRSQAENYATADLCLIDPAEGLARFIKVGAPPSYILRGGQVITLHTPTLPLGILDRVEPAAITRTLQDGDVIVLASDGVQGADNAWLEDFLDGRGQESPEELAGAILDASRKQWEYPDDRTVLAARVSCPHPAQMAFFQRQKLQIWKAKVSG